MMRGVRAVHGVKDEEDEVLPYSSAGFEELQRMQDAKG